MMRLKALVPPAPALAEHDWTELCQDYLKGACNENPCPHGAHKVCRVKENSIDASSATEIRAHNILATGVWPGKMPFETDGPGKLSCKGLRHDNDHLEIPDIKIMPTMDEILSTRMPYIPQKGFSVSHRYKPGVKKYMDTHFRQLRFECTASIIDACRSALRRVTGVIPDNAEWRQETENGIKYFLFRHVGVESTRFHENKGAMFQLSYDCPPAFQGPRKMSNAPFFEEGMLCALLAVHEDTSEVNIIFLQVHMRQSTDAMRSKTGTHNRAPVQVSLAEPEDTSKTAQMVFYHREQFKAKLYLVDMPNILVASFLSHLKTLQQLFVSENFAFKNYITAETPKAALLSASALRAPIELANNSRFNLNSLKKEENDTLNLDLTISPLNSGTELRNVLKEIKERTTLDDGQATALFESLNREIAFTQGPPGTGKTFLGVALVETLLKSRDVQKKHPPIVVVCQTNHALDDFIEELIRRGISKITRIGGGSTAKWITPYLIRNQRSDVKKSCKEATKLNAIRHIIGNMVSQCTSYAEALDEKSRVCWPLLETFLSEKHPRIHAHFMLLDQASSQKTGDDLRAAKMRLGFSFLYWQEGGDISDAKGLISAFSAMLGESHLTKNWAEAEIAALKEEIKNQFTVGVALASEDRSCQDLWSLDQGSRQRLALQWLEEANPWAVSEGFAELNRRFQATKAVRNQLYDDSDANLISELNIQIVGMTSTACATQRKLLEKLAPQVVLFEEASELIEVHSIIALVASVKYCVQIGDPLQLRPHVEQRDLSLEHNPKYRLDESLFERFMNSGIPFSQLNTQRRAHPEIADLLRVGDYPYLVDHSAMIDRPVVAGMASRMWWFDHNHPEDSIHALSPLSKSASNLFESRFITAFVRYLVEKQNYRFREITILTPYKGQLAALQNDLSQICSVSLTEEDRNELIDAALLEDKEHPDGQVLDVNLSDMLRIATIDNYQGEQARIIIFSAVRSNEKSAIGFLANRNRTNVAISRAEDGFFVIGNAKLMEQNDHWAGVIQCFREKCLIGNEMVTQCHRHPHKKWTVAQPADFDLAQCSEICNEQLPCGHVCKAPCHLPEMHTDGRMPCNEPCAKIRECSHSCSKLCSQRCGPCTALGDPIKLECGHSKRLECGQRLENAVCKEVIRTVDLQCGHIKHILCSDPQDNDVLACSEPCGVPLVCGHSCNNRCSDCQDKQNHHQDCSVICARKLECGHTCQSKCHAGLCPPCKQPCEKSCQHSRCKLTCGESCKPCIDQVESIGCVHSGLKTSATLCCLPRTTLPCSKICGKTLSCGIHACPSLCAEKCPTTCEECSTGAWPTTSTLTLTCGHTFPVQELDQFVKLVDIYSYDSAGDISGIAVTRIPKTQELVCPTCSRPIRSIRRYELACGLAGLPNLVEHLFGMCARKVGHSFSEVSIGEQILFAKFGHFLSTLATGPMSVNHNQRLIAMRCSRLIDAQTASQFGRATAIRVEQCLNDLYEQVHNADLFPPPTFSFSLRSDLLYFWSRLAMVEYAHRIAGKFGLIPNPDLQNRLLIKGYTAHAIEQAAGECTALHAKIEECQAKNLKRLETEFRIIQLCFWAILQMHKATSKVSVDTEASIVRCRKLVGSYPQTAGLFQGACEDISESVKNRRLAPRFWELCSARTNELWRELSRYRGGPLVLCKYSHLYPSEIFTHGCPECGEELHYVDPLVHDDSHIQENWKGDLGSVDFQEFAANIRNFCVEYKPGQQKGVAVTRSG